MGRFRAEAVIVRKVNDCEVIFYDGETIYVKDITGKYTVVFHRWHRPKGSYYKGWHQFRKRLLYNKSLTFNDCFRLAFQHDITSQATFRKPDLSKFKIQVRF